MRNHGQGGHYVAAAALACACLWAGGPALGSEPAFPFGEEGSYGQALLPWELRALSEEDMAAYRREIGAAGEAAQRREIVERWRAVMDSRDRGRLFLTIPGPAGPRDERTWRQSLNELYSPREPGETPGSGPAELPGMELRPYMEDLPQVQALREQQRLEERSLESLFPQAAERALVQYLLYRGEENFERDSRLLIAAGAMAPEHPERQALAASWRLRALTAAEAQLQDPQQGLDRFLERRGVDPDDLAELLLAARAPSAAPAPQAAAEARPQAAPATTPEEASAQAGAPFDGSSVDSAAPLPDPEPAQDPGEASPEPAPSAMDLAGPEPAASAGPAPEDQGEPDDVEDPDRWNPAINGAKWALWGGMIGFILGGPAGMLLLMAAAFVLGWTINEQASA